MRGRFASSSHDMEKYGKLGAMENERENEEQGIFFYRGAFIAALHPQCSD